MTVTASIPRRPIIDWKAERLREDRARLREDLALSLALKHLRPAMRDAITALRALTD